MDEIYLHYSRVKGAVFISAFIIFVVPSLYIIYSTGGERNIYLVSGVMFFGVLALGVGSLLILNRKPQVKINADDLWIRKYRGRETSIKWEHIDKFNLVIHRHHGISISANITIEIKKEYESYYHLHKPYPKALQTIIELLGFKGIVLPTTNLYVKPKKLFDLVNTLKDSNQQERKEMIAGWKG